MPLNENLCVENGLVFEVMNVDDLMKGMQKRSGPHHIAYTAFINLYCNKDGNTKK